MKTAFEKEPATVVSAITGFITAVIGLLVAFNINVTPDQQNAIVGVVAAMSTMIVMVGPIIRQFVSSPATVEQKKLEAFHEGIEVAQPTEPAPAPKPRVQIPKGDGVARFTRPGV